MSLLVEDGTGVAGAESYASVAAADAYWAARPHDVLAQQWDDADDPTKEGALRAATDFLDATWSDLFAGARMSATQGRLWPRVDRTVLGLNACYTTAEALAAAQAATDRPLFGRDGLVLAALPLQVVNATIELAVRALVAPLAPDVDPATPWIKREKVGPLETEYGGPSSAVVGGSYGFVDALLNQILIGPRNGDWNWA